MVKDDVKQIGHSFKQRREELAISLREIENATSIRLNFLQAIEEGDMSKLISPVYAQGFIKQYALYLGMDTEKLIKEHPDIFQRPLKQKQDFSYGIGTLESRGHPGSHVKSLPNALWIAALAAILIGAWYFAKYLDVV
jgi:cytoskeletal protein RodZ